MVRHKIRYDIAVERSGLLTKLGDFQVEIAGTAPLGLSVADSDIDVLCFSANSEPLEWAIWGAFSHEHDFSMRHWVAGGRAVIATFQAYGRTFQIYSEVMRLRAAGMKTIPAMMSILRCEGDPYGAAHRGRTDDSIRLRANMPRFSACIRWGVHRCHSGELASLS